MSDYLPTPKFDVKNVVQEEPDIRTFVQKSFPTNVTKMTLNQVREEIGLPTFQGGDVKLDADTEDFWVENLPKEHEEAVRFVSGGVFPVKVDE
jgi:hypothetical protein